MKYKLYLLFISYRYLTWFEAFLTNIDLSHPGALDYIKHGAISVARSLIPGALAAVDKTMDETFMKFAKSSGMSMCEHKHNHLYYRLMLVVVIKLRLLSLSTFQVVYSASSTTAAHTRSGAAQPLPELSSMNLLWRCAA